MNENAVTVVCKSLADSSMQDKFRAVLPSNVALDRFTRVTMTAIQKNPGILDADRASLYNSCVDAATRGLVPDGKEGALVKFRTKVRGSNGKDEWIDKVQFMPMPEGILKEMAKAGVKASAVSIHQNDEVEIWNDDDGQHFRHRPQVFGDRGERIGAVAWAKDSDGRTFVEAMNNADLDRVAAASRSKDKDGKIVGPWRDWPERMEQKSVLHRLRKRIAILGSDDVVERLREDDERMVLGADEAATPAPAAPAAKRPRGLQAVIDHAPQAPAAAPEREPGSDDDMGEDDDGRNDPFGRD